MNSAGKERVSIYGWRQRDSAEKHGDYLWQFSLSGTGPAQKQCPECNGHGPARKASLAAGRFDFPLWAGSIARSDVEE